MRTIRIPTLIFSVLLPMQPAWATDSVSTLINESIYLLELLVFALISVGLILVTLSIARSRKKISQFVTDCREEMNQERTALKLTLESVQEKEQQITYMAHLLQQHLEVDLPTTADTESSTDKKKAIEPEILVEVLDEQDSSSKAHVASKSSENSASAESVDPRMVAADGSIKQAHFGSQQFISQVNQQQNLLCEHIQHTVKQANQYLSDTLSDLQAETRAIEKEKHRIEECIFAIKANIRFKDTQSMNTKDSLLVQQLEQANLRLEQLTRSQCEITTCYQQAIQAANKLASGLGDVDVEVEEQPETVDAA